MIKIEIPQIHYSEWFILSRIKDEKPIIDTGGEWFIRLKREKHKWFVENNIEYSLEYMHSNDNPKCIIFNKVQDAVLFKLTTFF